MAWQDVYTKENLVERIRRYAHAGMTAAETAGVLGFGITKGIVCGLAWRAEPRIEFGKPPPPTPKFIIVDEGDSVSVHQDALREGDQRCRFPLWTSERPKRHELRYCGRPTAKGSSWCEDCAKTVFGHG